MGKFFFVSIVKTDTIAAQILGYDSFKEAEIKFYDEVAYGLKLDTIKSAFYEVKDETGINAGLTKYINNEKEEQ